MKIYLVLRISCIIFWHYHMGTFNLFAMKNRCRFFSSCLHVFQTDWQNIGGVSKEIFNEVNEYCLDLEAYMIINNKAKCNAKHFEPCYSGFFFFFCSMLMVLTNIYVYISAFVFIFDHFAAVLMVFYCINSKCKYFTSKHFFFISFHTMW